MRTIDVAEELAKMPAQPLAALRVLRLVEDPHASAADLGELVEMDPALSARVMRVANSPYYGLRTSVGSAARAVILLGFGTVKAVAAAAACGLLTEDASLGPPDFWAHSVSVAGAASVAADALGVARSDAFSAGLLHDVGTALLHRFDPDGYEAVWTSCAPGELAAAEREAYSVDHAAAGATALRVWHFPRAFVDAIAHHHDGAGAANPLGQAVILGHAVAEAIEALSPAEDDTDLDELTAALGLPAEAAGRLIEQTGRELERISQSIGAGL